MRRSLSAVFTGSQSNHTAVAFSANAENVARAVSEELFHALAELCGPCVGNKRLNRASKAAAVYADRAFGVQ